MKSHNLNQQRLSRFLSTLMSLAVLFIWWPASFGYAHMESDLPSIGWSIDSPALLGLELAPTLVEHCGTINSNETWNAAGNVHVVTCNVTVSTGVRLTIEEGTIIKFYLDQSLIVNGSLRVLGTASNLIYFTSIRDDTIGGDTNGDGGATTPAPGNWDRIEFGDLSDDATSLIDHAIIRYGGQAYPYYWGMINLVSASPTIQNTEIRNNIHCAIKGNLNSFPALSNNTLRDNNYNGFCLGGGSINANSTWSITDTSYFLEDNVTVANGSTLTVNPSVIVKFNIDKSLVVNGALRALGTSTNPIYFTSARDDTVGGDTNGDGGATTPAPGNWDRIEFGDLSDDANSLIDYAIIRYGGNPGQGWGAINLTGASPTIQNSTISTNNYAGVKTSSSTPVLGCNNIYSNTSYGLYNATTGVTVVAENTWWGSISGPYHSSNPSGTGNAVSNGVDFIPWRTSACGSPPNAPSNLIVTTISSTQLNLTWQDNSNDETTFLIERSPNGTSDWSEINTVLANSTNYADTDLNCSTKYYYRIRSYRQADDKYSGYSPVASAATLPCSPSNLSAISISINRIDLTWQDNSSDETNFYIERSIDGNRWNLIFVAAANSIHYSDHVLGCGATYYYRVRAYRSGDGKYSGYSNVAIAVTLSCKKVYMPVLIKSSP